MAKKRIISIITVIFCLLSLFSACDTTDNDLDKYTIVFAQSGYSDVLVKVENGKTLKEKDIPTPKPKKGYTIVWNVTDFSSITSDTRITATETPNIYKLYYSLKSGESLNDTNGLVFDDAKNSYYLLVTFDQSFTLKTLRATSGFSWTYNQAIDGILEEGIWSFDHDITVTSILKPDSSWGPEVKP